MQPAIYACATTGFPGGYSVVSAGFLQLVSGNRSRQYLDRLDQTCRRCGHVGQLGTPSLAGLSDPRMKSTDAIQRRLWIEHYWRTVVHLISTTGQDVDVHSAAVAGRGRYVADPPCSPSFKARQI